MAEVLTDEQARSQLAQVPGWEIVDGRLHRELTFGNFVEAFGFMARVALVAEKLDHHPDWSNSWNKVTIDITNHSAGGLTELCFQLATLINKHATGAN
jgi:4a-hydroxytetrahydrobiopterin dehydratase